MKAQGIWPKPCLPPSDQRHTDRLHTPGSYSGHLPTLGWDSLGFSCGNLSTLLIKNSLGLLHPTWLPHISGTSTAGDYHLALHRKKKKKLFWEALGSLQWTEHTYLIKYIKKINPSPIILIRMEKWSVFCNLVVLPGPAFGINIAIPQYDFYKEHS